MNNETITFKFPLEGGGCKETNETRGKIVSAIYKDVFYLLPV